LTLSNTSSFLTRSVQLIFSILLQHYISNLHDFWSYFIFLIVVFREFMGSNRQLRCWVTAMFVTVWSKSIMNIETAFCVRLKTPLLLKAISCTAAYANLQYRFT
jgi:hypothetical protein